MKITGGAGIAAGVVALLVASFVLSTGTGASACTPGTVNIAAVAKVTDSIDGYSGDQLINAAQVMKAATSLNLTGQAQTIGVMTAMAESGLRNLDHSSSPTRPDAVGLFQQDPSWGTAEERTDPGTAAVLFFTYLQTIPGWATMTPTAAAQAVQHSTSADVFAGYFAKAAAVVDGLSNIAGGGACGAHQAGDDYPWPTAPTQAQGGGLSPLRYYYRECVDFVAWRLNRDAGITTAPWKYTWANLTPLGGDAKDWKANWISHGWTVSSNPIPGAVAWWSYSNSGLGHVAYVQTVNSNDTVTLEEYNWNSNHLYSTRTIAAGKVQAYLYPPPR
jgi:surface antigen